MGNIDGKRMSQKKYHKSVNFYLFKLCVKI